MKPLEILFGIIRIPIDFLLTLAAFLIAYNLRLTTDLIPGIQLPVTASLFPNYQQYFTSSALAATTLILIFAFAGLYSLKRPETLSKQITKIFISCFIWLLVIISYYFFNRTFPFSRLAIIDTCLLAFALTSLGRCFLQYFQNLLYRRGIAQTKVLLLGATNTAEELLKNYFRNPQFSCVGYLDEQNHNLSHLRYLGTIKHLSPIIEKYKIEKIIQTKEHLAENQEENILEYCREHQLEFSFIPSQLAMQTSNVEIETIDGIPLISLKPTPLDGWGRVIKRGFDFFVSLIAIIIFSPLMAIIALAIKLEDHKGNILFIYLDDGSRVKRVGQKGKLFNFLKFRSMIPNSHNLRYTELAELNTRKDTPMVKIKNDPRITKVGKILRKFSLDELPQLFNVLRGEMSLVGPRPHLPEEVAKYQKHHKFVLTIKPGITGMAQVSGRSDLDFEREIKLDTYYIENWSPLLDLKILFQTVLVVFKRYEE